MIIVIDGNEIQTVLDFHKIIEDKFKLDFYGKCPNALWNVLTEITSNVSIWWLYPDKSKANLGNDFYSIQQVLLEAEAFHKLKQNKDNANLTVYFTTRGVDTEAY